MSSIATTVMPAAIPPTVRATEIEQRERTVSAVATTQTSPAAIASEVRSFQSACPSPTLTCVVATAATRNHREPAANSPSHNARVR